MSTLKLRLATLIVACLAALPSFANGKIKYGIGKTAFIVAYSNISVETNINLRNVKFGDLVLENVRASVEATTKPLCFSVRPYSAAWARWRL